MARTWMQDANGRWYLWDDEVGDSVGMLPPGANPPPDGNQRRPFQPAENGYSVGATGNAIQPLDNVFQSWWGNAAGDVPGVGTARTSSVTDWLMELWDAGVQWVRDLVDAIRRAIGDAAAGYLPLILLGMAAVIVIAASQKR